MPDLERRPQSFSPRLIRRFMSPVEVQSWKPGAGVEECCLGWLAFVCAPFALSWNCDPPLPPRDWNWDELAIEAKIEDGRVVEASLETKKGASCAMRATPRKAPVSIGGLRLFYLADRMASSSPFNVKTRSSR